MNVQLENLYLKRHILALQRRISDLEMPMIEQEIEKMEADLKAEQAADVEETPEA